MLDVAVVVPHPHAIGDVAALDAHPLGNPVVGRHNRSDLLKCYLSEQDNGRSTVLIS